MTDNLKPCPFCGGEVEIVKDDSEYKFVLVHCKNCDATIGIGDSEDEKKVIEAWNTRPNPWHTGTPTEEGWYLLLYKSIGGEFIPETKHFNFIKDIIETRPDVFMDIYPLWQKLELPTKADIEKITPFEGEEVNG